MIFFLQRFLDFQIISSIYFKLAVPIGIYPVGTGEIIILHISANDFEHISFGDVHLSVVSPEGYPDCACSITNFNCLYKSRLAIAGSEFHSIGNFCYNTMNNDVLLLVSITDLYDLRGIFWNIIISFDL